MAIISFDTFSLKFPDHQVLKTKNRATPLQATRLFRQKHHHTPIPDWGSSYLSHIAQIPESVNEELDWGGELIWSWWGEIVDSGRKV